MKTYWQDVTPAMADELQRSDVRKRSLSATHAQAFARDMVAGRWKASPQGLILDHLGRLIDGWHRMRAVSIAQVTVRFWVTETESEAETKEIEEILDLGRPRTFSDRLAFEGQRNNKLLAAITRRAFSWKVGEPWTRRTVATSEELDQIVREDRSLEEAARFGTRWKTDNYLLSASLAGFSWWVLHQVDTDREESDWFLSSLKSGAGLSEDSPVLALRERLHAPRTIVANSSRGTLTPELRLWCVFHGWELFRARRSVKLIKLPVVPITNDNFPRPK